MKIVVFCYLSEHSCYNEDFFYFKVSIMIVIFCDGSSVAQNPYIGVGVIGFRANDEGIIQDHLFSIKTQFNGKYVSESMHEDFALIKALGQAQNYPDEKIIIGNDCSMVIDGLKKKNIMNTKNKIRTSIWKNIDLSILDNDRINLKVLSRYTIGIRLTDVISKKHINSADIESEKFNQIVSIMKSKHYETRANIDESCEIDFFNKNKKTAYEPMKKPKWIDKKMSNEIAVTTAIEKEVRQQGKILPMEEYFALHPELYEDPPKLTFSFS